MQQWFEAEVRLDIRWLIRDYCRILGKKLLLFGIDGSGNGGK